MVVKLYSEVGRPFCHFKGGCGERLQIVALNLLEQHFPASLSLLERCAVDCINPLSDGMVEFFKGAENLMPECGYDVVSNDADRILYIWFALVILNLR